MKHSTETHGPWFHHRVPHFVPQSAARPCQPARRWAGRGGASPAPPAPPLPSQGPAGFPPSAVSPLLETASPEHRRGGAERGGSHGYSGRSSRRTSPERRHLTAQDRLLPRFPPPRAAVTAVAAPRARARSRDGPVAARGAPAAPLRSPPRRAGQGRAGRSESLRVAPHRWGGGPHRAERCGGGWRLYPVPSGSRFALRWDARPRSHSRGAGRKGGRRAGRRRRQTLPESLRGTWRAGRVGTRATQQDRPLDRRGAGSYGGGRSGGRRCPAGRGELGAAARNGGQIPTGASGCSGPRSGAAAFRRWRRPGTCLTRRGVLFPSPYC